jgi:hypothetical protein
MNKIQTWVIVSLTIIIILLLITQKSEPDRTLLDQTIQESENKIATLRQERSRLALKIAQDSLESLRKDSVYKSAIKIKERRISDLKRNPTVVQIREEVPVIDTLILAYDSIIAFQSARIYDVHKELTGLMEDIAKVRINFEAQMSEMQNTQEVLVSTIEKQRKQIKKESRKAKVAKILAVVGTIGGFLACSSL